jgi:hypothetical protein
MGALRYAGTYGGVTLGIYYPYTSGITHVRGPCQVPRNARFAQYLRSPYVTTIAASSIYTQIQSTTISVSVFASPPTNGWNTYLNGIYSGCTISATITGTNHAVILVGVDSVGNYKIRNSWGALWGESGYIRVSVQYDCGVPLHGRIPVLL